MPPSPSCRKGDVHVGAMALAFAWLIHHLNFKRGLPAPR